MDLRIKFDAEKSMDKFKNKEKDDCDNLLSKTKHNIGIKKAFYSLLVSLVIIAYIYYFFWIILIVS